MFKYAKNVKLSLSGSLWLSVTPILALTGSHCHSLAYSGPLWLTIALLFRVYNPCLAHRALARLSLLMPRWRTFSRSVFGKIWVWDISIDGKIKIAVDYVQRLWNSPHHYCLYWIEVLLLKISTLHRLVCWCLTHFHVDVDVECTSPDVQVSGLFCHK